MRFNFRNNPEGRTYTNLGVCARPFRGTPAAGLSGSHRDPARPTGLLVHDMELPMTTLLKAIRASERAESEDGVFEMLAGFDDLQPAAQADMIIDLVKAAYRLGYEERESRCFC